MSVKEGGAKVIDRFEAMDIGKRTVNFHLRDAIFSRQRYWGEPFPIYYKDEMPYTLSEGELPLLLPEVDKYLPTESGEPPLARAKNWKTKDGYPLETSTMPGFAGSSAYHFRYMDPNNDHALVSQEAIDYWKEVDLYIGGAEHATGHLIYVRFWNMFLYDLGICPQEEPFKKLINQGMIQGRSNFVYRIKNANTFVSYNIRNEYETDPIHVDINIVDNDVLDVEAFRKWRPEFSAAEFILEDGKYICGYEIEKMSKSMYNVQNPDDLVERYGADTLRLYEMFLGPLEQSKPWDTKGIEGTARFIKKLWRLYHDNENQFRISNEPATKEELKALHKVIKKIADDIERFSFNTAVSAFMICVNELSDLKCNKRKILEPLCITIAPFAPHIAEELWNLLGHTTSVTQASYPVFNEAHIAENSFEYPVSVNGKMRFKMELPLDMSVSEIEKTVVAAEEAQKWLEGKPPKKIIVVQGKIINMVV
jgi:leucyl-tRNA synthetase